MSVWIELNKLFFSYLLYFFNQLERETVIPAGVLGKSTLGKASVLYGNRIQVVLAVVPCPALTGGLMEFEATGITVGKGHVRTNLKCK